MEDIRSLIDRDFERIGEPIDGGFATVYIVRHKELKYFRAIKTLPISIYNVSDEKRLKAQKDFKDECIKLMRLTNGHNHNIVNIYKCEIEKEPYYMEMDYVKGDMFHDYAAKNYMPIKEVFKFISNIGGALAYCHNNEDVNGEKTAIVHNDLHSGNIIRRVEDGEYILLDFGLSMDGGEVIRSSKKNTGWCEFMPPERCEMDFNPEKQYQATPAWDIYSFGCLIYMALTGQAPFPKIKNGKKVSDVSVQQSHLNVDREEPWKMIGKLRQQHHDAICPNEEYLDDCPEWLISMIKTCLSKSGSDRYKDAEEFMKLFNINIEKSNVPYSEYEKLLEQVKMLEEEKVELQRTLEELQEFCKKLGKKAYALPLKRNWIISIVLILAFASNCMKYHGDVGSESSALPVISIILSVIASIVIIGVMAYDTYCNSSKNKNN